MQTANRQSESVADRVQTLLDRVANIRRGSEINRPVYFAAGGEQHAREVARRDAKGVDTVLASASPRRFDANTPPKSSPGPAAVEPLTGTYVRLRLREAR